jgi:hypothetical protein
MPNLQHPLCVLPFLKLVTNLATCIRGGTPSPPEPSSQIICPEPTLGDDGESNHEELECFTEEHFWTEQTHPSPKWEGAPMSDSEYHMDDSDAMVPTSLPTIKRLITRGRARTPPRPRAIQTEVERMPTPARRQYSTLVPKGKKKAKAQRLRPRERSEDLAKDIPTRENSRIRGSSPLAIPAPGSVDSLAAAPMSVTWKTVQVQVPDDPELTTFANPKLATMHEITQAHYMTMYQAFNQQPTNVLQGGPEGYAIRARDATLADGTQLSITDSEVAVSASLLLGLKGCDWTAVAYFLQSIGWVTKLSKDNIDFSIFMDGLYDLADKSVRWVLDRYNPQTFWALKGELDDSVAKADNAAAVARASLDGLHEAKCHNTVKDECIAALEKALNEADTWRKNNCHLLTTAHADIARLQQQVKASERELVEESTRTKLAQEQVVQEFNCANSLQTKLDGHIQALGSDNLALELAELKEAHKIIRARYIALLDSHPSLQHAMALLPPDLQAGFAEVLNLPPADFRSPPPQASLPANEPPMGPPKGGEKAISIQSPTGKNAIQIRPGQAHLGYQKVQARLNLCRYHRSAQPG